MNSITKGQFFTMIFTAGTFFAFSSACAQNLSELAGALISAMITCAVFIVLAIAAKNKTPNKFINILLFFVMLAAGAGSIASFFNVQKNVDLGIDHELLCAILLSVAVIYCASLKITAAARCSAIVFGAVIATLFLLIIGAFSKLEISNLALEFDLETALSYSYSNVFNSAVFAIAAALVLKKQNKAAVSPDVWAILGVSVLSIILSTLSICISDIEAPTYFALAKSAQPFSVQSGEWIYIIIYGMLSVLCLSLIVKLASDCLKAIFPKIRFATTVSALSTFLCAHLMTRFSLDTKTVLAISQIGAVSVLVAMLFMSENQNNKTFH